MLPGDACQGRVQRLQGPEVPWAQPVGGRGQKCSRCVRGAPSSHLLVLKHSSQQCAVPSGGYCLHGLGGAWGCRSLGLQPSPIRGSHPPHPLSYYRCPCGEGLTSPCLSVLDKLRGSRPDRHSCGKGWGTGGHLQQQGQPDWLSPPTPVLLSLPLSQSHRTLGSSPQGHCVPSGVKKTLQK